MKNNNLIVVLGMHRSGTSAMTRGLQVLGIELGARMMPPVHGINNKGFWEDIDLTDFNVEMLNAINSHWDNLTPVSSVDVATLRKLGYVQRAVEIIQGKVGGASHYGFKDPRVARLLPFWKEVFVECGYHVSYILAIRNPLSVAQSLLKRDELELAHSYLLWFDHVITSLHFSDDSSRIVIDYDRLMRDPDHELNRLGRHLGCAINEAELQKYKAEFLDDSLRHSQYQLADLSAAVECPEIVKEIYTDLLEIAADNVSLEDPNFVGKAKLWKGELEKLSLPLKMVDKFKNAFEVEMKRRVADAISSESDKAQLISEFDRKIAELTQHAEAVEKNAADLVTWLRQATHTRDEILASTSWKITRPIRALGIAISRVRRLIGALPGLIAVGGGLLQSMRKIISIYHKEGRLGIRIRIRHYFSVKATGPVELKAQRSTISTVPYYIDPNLDRLTVNPTTHIFAAIHLYVDQAGISDECLGYLRCIPFPVDLYGTISDHTDPQVIELRLRSVGVNIRHIVLEKGKNDLGRLACMTMQFGEQLQQYNVIGHVCANPEGANDGKAIWTESMLKLLGPLGSSGGRIARMTDMLCKDKKIIVPGLEMAGNRKRIALDEFSAFAREMLGEQSAIDLHDIDIDAVPIFWASVPALSDFLRIRIDLESNAGMSSGSGIHSDLYFTKLLVSLATRSGAQILQVIEGDSIRDFRQYEEQHAYRGSITHQDIQVLSYYLPQFHPTPENDLWHGKGFTEWTKVRAANPLFEGHYQQHIPHPDIGYYLLDSPQTLRDQAAVMKKAGVHGQIFYHYWFTGKLILEHPAQMLLASPDIDMPYCFCWANENWTKRWDGDDREILLGQEYSEQDAVNFIRYLIPFFKDPRYIKVDGRPMLQVYRPLSMPDVQQYLGIWAHECELNGVLRPYVVAVLTRGATNPDDFGMDAGVERVLHDWTDGAGIELKDSVNRYGPIERSVLSYESVADFYTSQTDAKNFTYFRSIVPIWDNTARYGCGAYVLHGSTPQYFQKWLESIIAYSKSNLPPDRRFVIVNAWNEWAEGAHLEPDTRYGYSYLNSIGRALSDIPYAQEVGPIEPIDKRTSLHIKIDPAVINDFKKDPLFRERFEFALKKSSVFSVCSVSLNSQDLLQVLPQATYVDQSHADYVLEINAATYFDSDVILTMLNKSHATGAIVIPNFYGEDNSAIAVTDNGSVSAEHIGNAPMVIFPKNKIETEPKNVRMTLSSRCFLTRPSQLAVEARPAVTTIVRFHQRGDMNDLRNALYCLYAMDDCIAVPLIAAQDLSVEQKSQLHDLISEFNWVQGFEPVVTYYHSQTGTEDLRSQMLNESLKKVKTAYAAFLDYDDFLFSNAYRWLLNRLDQTGKAIAFGRVYWSDYLSLSGKIVDRKRSFEKGYSYVDFVENNHAPLHSFMLNVKKLDLAKIKYFNDQKYMEDYLLTLQLITAENADWDSLKENHYVGDYIHCIDRANTLAITDDAQRKMLLSNDHYKLCERRINDVRKTLKY